MAKIRTISPVGTISGVLGSMEFARTRRGQIVKRRKCPSNKSSAKQVRQHATLAAATSKWHSLSDADRGSWNTLAAIGAIPYGLQLPQNLSGYQLFLKYYPHEFCTRYPAGILFTPPHSNQFMEFPGIVSLTINYTIPAFTIKTTAPLGDARYISEEVYVSRFCRSTQRTPTRWLRLARRPKTAAQMDYTTEFTSDPCRLVKDELIWIKVRQSRWNFWPSTWASTWGVVVGSPP